MHVQEKLIVSYDFSRPINIIILVNTAYRYFKFVKITVKQSSNQHQARRNCPQTCCGEYS